MKIFLLAAAAAIFLPGCYSTQLTGYWRSSQEPARQYRKVLVMGMMPDTLMRHRMEAHVAGDLTDRGILALTSFQDFDAFAFIETEDKDVMKQFRDKRIDGVLTITLVNQSMEGFFLPGSLYHLLCNYYSSEYYKLFAPEYYKESIQYAWESSFYDVDAGGRIFAIQTVTFDPASVEAMAHEYGKVISRQLYRHKVISRP
ncbi:hypothetical protein [Chitinophaga sp. 22620]|uniref:hypothetical protein n=1 Tax=Chitinophaga sp. 22620 TaxID=3453952 RepID=UPI003F8739B9